jgi:hypothetical protein
VARAFSFAGLLAVLALVGDRASGQYPTRQNSLPSGTNAPQRTAVAQPTVAVAPPGSAGKVMYFYKPADALMPASGPGEDAVAQVSAPTQPGDAVAQLPALPVAQAQPEPIPIQPKKNPDPTAKTPDPSEYTKLPPREIIFGLPGDADLEKLVLKSLRDVEAKRIEMGKPVDPYQRYPRGLTFPPLPQAGEGLAYVPKTPSYEPMHTAYDSLYQVHRRLLFEDKNSERYGWDLGIVQPFVSAMIFYKDVLFLPSSIGAGFAYGFWDTNAGKCLPGSPTPYMLYPPELTITGGLLEGAVITGAAFAIP